ncbi:MAG TPA: hypothetical protein VL947_09465 [Cytophagales bacterium]|nr:hypothetical protein [Cytophagales bacterium]
MMLSGILVILIMTHFVKVQTCIDVYDDIYPEHFGLKAILRNLFFHAIKYREVAKQRCYHGV